MRHFAFTITTVLLTTLSATGLTAEDKPNGTAQEKLQGRWEIVAGVNQGRKLSKAELSGTYVTIKTNSIVAYDRDNHVRYQTVFTLDEDKKPIEIMMRSIEEKVPTKPTVKATGGNAWGNHPSAVGIIKFDSETKWRLCYALPGSDRPERFESPEGSKLMLFTLEKKPSDPVSATLRKNE